MPTSFGRKYNGVCASTLAPQYKLPPSASLVVPGVRSRGPNAGRRKAAHEVRPHLEVVQHAQSAGRPKGSMTPACSLKTLMTSEKTS